MVRPVSTYKLVFLLVLYFLLSSCGGGDDPEPQPVVSYDRTVLIYMCADNSLGISAGKTNAFSTDDFNEMVSGISSSSVDASKNVLLVYLDDKSSTLPTLYRLTKTSSGTVEQSIVYQYASDVNSAKKEVLSEVISRAFSEYPAKSYGFVYWSHGDGWIPAQTRSLFPMELRWIGVDDTNGLSYTEITDLASILKAQSPKLEFLMFDACFMSSIETLYDLRDCANYFIVSPTEIPGPGAPYQVLVPAMFKSSPALSMGQEYFKAYANIYNGGINSSGDYWTAGVSISVINASKLDRLAAVTKEHVSATSWTVDDLRERVLDYDKRQTNSHVGYYDLSQLMKLLASESGYSAWKTVYDDAITFFSTTEQNYSFYIGMFPMSGSTGLSTYIPGQTTSTVSKDKAFQATSWYKDAGLSKLGW